MIDDRFRSQSNKYMVDQAARKKKEAGAL